MGEPSMGKFANYLTHFPTRMALLGVTVFGAASCLAIGEVRAQSADPAGASATASSQAGGGTTSLGVCQIESQRPH
jgi:hypothetical protein